MSDRAGTSWDEVVDKLRGAAADLRSAAGHDAASSVEEEEAATRLKSDVTRLEQSAADLRAKLASSLDSQKSELETSLGRERAEQTAGQFKAALDELAGLAKTVTLELKGAAEASFSQAQPELKTAIRALEDVAGSAGTWVRTMVDPDRAHGANQPTARKPPLDDL